MKNEWITNWKMQNKPWGGEDARAYEERAEHAWTTHNEDPGAGIISGTSWPEPPAGDSEPVPDDVAAEATDENLDVTVADGLILDVQPHRATDGLTADMHPDDLMVEGFGALPAAPEPAASGVPVPLDYEMIDVPCAPGYRVNRPLYSATWFFYRPGSTVPEGSFPNGGLAMNAAVDDYNAAEERRLAVARPIGRTVADKPLSRPIGTGTPSECRAKLARTEPKDPAPIDGDFPYGYYATKHKATGLWTTYLKNDTGDGAVVRAGMGTRDEAKDAAALDYAERNGSRSEVEVVAARIAKKGVVAHRDNARPRRSAPVVPLVTRVVLESPYAGEVERNVDYARAAMADCLARGEAPFASHLLYTQIGVLDDTNPEERQRGIEAGYMIAEDFGKAVFYLDYGMSPGMAAALVRFARARKVVEFRFLGIKKASDDAFDL